MDVKNPKIVGIVQKAEELKISPQNAEEQLQEYLVGELPQTYLSDEQLEENRTLLKAIINGFELPFGKRTVPLNVAYWR